MSGGGALSITARQLDTAATIEVATRAAEFLPRCGQGFQPILHYQESRQWDWPGYELSRSATPQRGAEFETEMGRGTTFRLILPLIGAKQHERRKL